jgi:catechol 2,3-dioxygenase-like lactoylglutathione lyase family enzyme
MGTAIKYICPLLVVADMSRARTFYESILGQKVIMDFGENITFDGNFSLHLQSHYQSLIDNKEIRFGGHDFELYFECIEMEALYQKLLEISTTFVHEMREQPWRQRVIRFYDPDNHIIEVGESMEHLSYRLFSEGISVEEISKIMMMPIEFVENSIENCADKKG